MTVVWSNPSSWRLRQEDQIFEAKLARLSKGGGVGAGVTGDCRGFEIAPPTDGRMGTGKGQRGRMEITCSQGAGFDAEITFPLDPVLYLRGKSLFGSIRN